jgi:hypothetical protein
LLDVWFGLLDQSSIVSLIPGKAPRERSLAVHITALWASAMLDWSQCPAVERVPGKVSGAWVFRGTRVPVKALFETWKMAPGWLISSNGFPA